MSNDANLDLEAMKEVDSDQRDEAIWAHYSGSFEGINIYINTTVVFNDGRLITLHVANSTPSWNSIDHTSVEFLGNLRW